MLHNNTFVKPATPACPTTPLPGELPHVLPQDDIDPLVAELFADLEASRVEAAIAPVAPKKAPNAPSPATTAPAEDTTAREPQTVQTRIEQAPRDNIRHIDAQAS